MPLRDNRTRGYAGLRSGLYASVLTLAVLVGGGGGAWADAAFNAAVKSYQSRNYRQAIGQFTALKATYPKNGLVHYYLALSQQGVGNRGAAKAEYEWLLANDQTQLRTMAQTGLQNLGVSPAAQQQPPKGGGQWTGNSLVGGGNEPIGKPKLIVTKIIDFYTTWCPQCKRLDPIFDQMKSKFPDINFQKLDAEEPGNAGLVAQYGVNSYPRLVYLDNSGKVLQNNRGFPGTVEGLESNIRQYR